MKDEARVSQEDLLNEFPIQLEELSNDLRVLTRAPLELERVLSAAAGTKQVAKLRTRSEVVQGTVEKVAEGWAQLASMEGRTRSESHVRLDTVESYTLSPPA